MKIFKNILMLFAFLFSVQSYAQVDSSKSVTMDQFKEIINHKDTTIVILDVRTEEEVNGPLAKINGAINIPLQELDKRINELEKYKDKEILVVCRTQNRSSKAAEFLTSKDYNAKNVIGGMQEYYKK